MTSTKRFIRLMAALLALIFVINTAPLAALAEAINPPEDAAGQPAEHDHDHDHDHEQDAEETGEGIITQLVNDEENTLYREVKFALPDGLTDDEAAKITLPETKLVENGALIFAIPRPERTDYTFAGWYYDEAGTKPFAASEKVLLTDPNVRDLTLNLYAKFTPVS